MTKITSIDPVERMVDRGAKEAQDELHACTLDSLDCVEKLAKTYPGAVAIGSIAFGTPNLMAFTVSADDEGRETPHYLPVASDCARWLGRIIGNLPGELLEAFEDELAVTKASRREKG